MECCGKFGKFILIILNVLFILFGLALLIVGILVIADVALINDKIMPLLNEVNFGSGMNLGTTANSLTIMMIVFGVIICVIAGLGACGACCENRLTLIIYAIIVGILFIGKVVVVILWFVMRNDLETEIKSQLKTQIETNYKNDDLTTNEISTAWNYLFMELSCCAVNAVTGTTNDFDNSVWKKNGATKEIPTGCCSGATVSNYATYSEAACTDTVTSGYYTKGCYDAIYDIIKKYSGIFIGVGITVLLIEIIAIIFACVICREVSKQNEVV